jgi:hypothetical protein
LVLWSAAMEKGRRSRDGGGRPNYVFALQGAGKIETIQAGVIWEIPVYEAMEN